MKRYPQKLLLCLGLLGCATTSETEGWRLLDVHTTGPCVESAMVWDTAREVFVLHSGRSRDWDMLAETWEWAPGATKWSRVVDAGDPSPGPRMSHAMVWDSKRERMLLFGGYRNEEYLNDTWAYDAKTSGWVKLHTTGNPPSRSQCGMVYDPDGDEILLFGGRGAGHQPLHDTWSLDLKTLGWTKLLPPKGAPPPPRSRDHVQMARDPLSGITVICGHSLGEGLPDETWHFDAKARIWNLVETAGQPQGGSHDLLCAVEAAGGLMLVGSDSDSQTWLYQPRTKSWTQLDPGGQAPELPIDHGQVGSDGQHLFVFAGFGGDDVPEDAGLTPRGALWMYLAAPGPER